MSDNLAIYERAKALKYEVGRVSQLPMFKQAAAAPELIADAVMIIEALAFENNQIKAELQSLKE